MIRTNVEKGLYPKDHLEKAEIIVERAKAKSEKTGLSIDDCLEPLVEGSSVFVFPQIRRIDPNDSQLRGRIGRSDIQY